jgi:hypothetical protein
MDDRQQKHVSFVITPPMKSEPLESLEEESLLKPQNKVNIKQHVEMKQDTLGRKYISLMISNF